MKPNTDQQTKQNTDIEEMASGFLTGLSLGGLAMLVALLAFGFILLAPSWAVPLVFGGAISGSSLLLCIKLTGGK